MSRSIASPVPGQTGQVLTIWALTASGSFDAENEQLLDKITVSTDSVGYGCQAQDDSSGTGKVSSSRRAKWKNAIVALCLWFTYMLCGVAYSTINPFFPQIVWREPMQLLSELTGCIFHRQRVKELILS